MNGSTTPMSGAEPGQSVRRALVIATAALTTLLASALPLHGFGILLVAILAGLDILLCRATGRSHSGGLQGSTSGSAGCGTLPIAEASAGSDLPSCCYMSCGSART